MNCPRGCAQGLERYVHADVELDRCLGCEGLWLDIGEGELVSRPDDMPQELLDRIALDLAYPQDDKSTAMPCPRCEKVMARERFSKSGVEIDRCGCGVWLDKGELEKIQAHRKRALEELARQGDDYPPLMLERAMARFFFDLGTPPD